MIDAHHHLWRIGRNGCAWPPPTLAAIHRDFELDEFEALARGVGVTGGVLVQSQPCDADTDYLLDLAADEAFVLGVVGWTDLASPDAPARIGELAARPKLKGLRPMLQALEADDWIAVGARADAAEAMVRCGLVFDALVDSRHLEALLVFARRHPALAIVIDHGGKPAIARGLIDPWRERMAALAAQPQVSCKLSGLLTEAGEARDTAALKPYVNHLIDIFGESRLIWGGDWPVLNLAGSYGGWVDQALALTESLGAEARRLIFEANARRIYDL